VTVAAAPRVASVVATAFLVGGILGFVPGVTTRFGALELAGRDSRAQVFGVFDVSVLLLLVYALLGLAGLALARTATGARRYLVGAGAVCAALWIFGLVVARDDAANFIPVDEADTWLHFGLGAILLVGYVPHQKDAAKTT
jgi:hypothetical protein